MSTQCKKPEIFCALLAYFPEQEIENILSLFTSLGFSHLSVGTGRYWRGRRSICFGEIYYQEYWEIGDALADLFRMIPIDFRDFCQQIFSNNGNVLIDIAFVAYELFPVLVFEGEVMNKIRMLRAEIEIDPYH